MDTPNDQQPEGQPPYVPPAEQYPPQGYAPPPAAPYPPVGYGQPAPQPPKKKLSTGAKWAIGLGIAFLLFFCGSCWFFAASVGTDETIALGDSIAVIRMDEPIQSSSGGNGDPENILDQIDQALADTSVKAIVLRIDSPGGTVAASQEIALGVQRAREVMPVVVSVGDVCASGGYMVAAQADEIVASPGSTVGSIGVIMEVVNAEELLDKVGLSFTTLTYGEYKDAGSFSRSLTETETAMLNEQLTAIGDQFIADVAEGRDMDEADVRELATGWAWIGTEALELGLVDSLGNYDDAIDRAAELGGIEGEPNIVSYEYVDPFSDFLFSLFGVISERNGLDAESLQRIGLPR